MISDKTGRAGNKNFRQINLMTDRLKIEDINYDGLVKSLLDLFFKISDAQNSAYWKN